jgi:hypothetical protein
VYGRLGIITVSIWEMSVVLALTEGKERRKEEKEKYKKQVLLDR